MKYSIAILTTIALMAALVLSGCDNSDNKVQDAETSAIEADRDLEIAKTEVEAELRIYRTENENRLAQYEQRIEEIKRDIDNESDAQRRAELEAKVDEHQATHRNLTRDMNNYRVSDRENWSSFKNSFTSRMDNLGDSLDNFFTGSNTRTNTNQQ